MGARLKLNRNQYSENVAFYRKTPVAMAMVSPLQQCTYTHTGEVTPRVLYNPSRDFSEDESNKSLSFMVKGLLW